MRQPLPVERDSTALALPSLTEVQLDTVRLLAREGNREVIIRRTLGLNQRDWKALRDADESSLADALEHGRAEGLSEVVAFMKRRMTQANSEAAAQWIANRLYGEADKKDDKVPRVVINIGGPMSPEEYDARARVDVIEHDANG